MSEEEIKRIAEEFTKAKMIADGLDPNNEHNKTLYEMDVEESIVRFRWLLKDYCIVPKSKVIEEYNFYKNSWNETELTETFMESFELLFGSELFEQKGK